MCWPQFPKPKKEAVHNTAEFLFLKWKTFCLTMISSQLTKVEIKLPRKCMHLFLNIYRPRVFGFFFQVFLSTLRKELYSPHSSWQQIPCRGGIGMASAPKIKDSTCQHTSENNCNRTADSGKGKPECLETLQG